MTGSYESAQTDRNAVILWYESTDLTDPHTVQYQVIVFIILTQRSITYFIVHDSFREPFVEFNSFFS